MPAGESMSARCPSLTWRREAIAALRGCSHRWSSMPLGGALACCARACSPHPCSSVTLPLAAPALLICECVERRHRRSDSRPHGQSCSAVPCPWSPSTSIPAARLLDAFPLAARARPLLLAALCPISGRVLAQPARRCARTSARAPRASGVGCSAVPSSCCSPRASLAPRAPARSVHPCHLRAHAFAARPHLPASVGRLCVGLVQAH